MAAATGDLEGRLMSAVKASAARGDPPLLQAAEAARCAREASACGGARGGLAAALVSNLCFEHNTGAMWKLLDQAMASRLVSPHHTLALLTPRVVPNRRAQPEAYRLYLELLGRYAVVPVCSNSTETKAMIARSIDDAMQLSHSYGFQQMDFGHTVILFVLSIINILTDCILEDWGFPSICSKEHDNVCATEVHKNMAFDCKGSPLDRRDEQREHLRRNNTLMALEVVEKITANKNAQVFLRLVYLNVFPDVSTIAAASSTYLFPNKKWFPFIAIASSANENLCHLSEVFECKIILLAWKTNLPGRPENFKSLLQRLQVTVALKSKNVATANTLLDNFMTHIQKVRSTGYQLGRRRLLRVLVSTHPSSSAACNVFGTGKGSCWIPFDLFMENAMDGRHLHAISSIDALTELSKMLQALNRATWQETFQALWVSALRLVQRDPGTLEGPFPHLDSRLCLLLAIVPLAIAPILNEDADNLERGGASARTEELVSCLHVLGQYFDLLSPPPAALHSANAAATKAAVAVYSLKAGSENIHIPKDGFSIKAVGNMLHLIVEACIARNLVDTSVYFCPGYVVPVKNFSPVHQSPWQALMEGSPLMDLKDVLMVTPASSLSELEKLHYFAVSGSEEEKLAASKILCGASFLRGWNIQEHVVQMVLQLLSTFPSLDSGSDGCYTHHMPMLHALLSGISSIDTVHILSMYGLVPEVAAILTPICEIFGSLPKSDNRSCNFGDVSVYSIFSIAFLSLLRLWKFHRPSIENALSCHGVSVWQLNLDYLLLLRNSRLALKNRYNGCRASTLQFDRLFQKPVYIDSFPKLRAWYFQNQACIASTISSAYEKKSIPQLANRILRIVCRKMTKVDLSVNPQATSNSSMSGSPVGVQEDVCEGPPVTAWEVLEAVPFVLESVLTACAHGRLSSRDLITGLRDLVDFLPASLAAIVSFCSAESTRGIWKPVMLNGTDWPSPAATLLEVESGIKEVLASAGVHVNISPQPRSVMPMLPLPVAALVSLTITVTIEEINHLQGIISQGLEICATSSSWPSMPIVGALWSQKVRRWHNFIILTCSESPFTRDNNTVAQLIRSCFSSFLGPVVNGRSCFVANRGVTGLMGQSSGQRGSRPSVSPGYLYMRSCGMFLDNNFVCEEILKVVIERARALAIECGCDRPSRLRSGRMPLSCASSSVEQIASLAATMLCHAGGVKLIHLLYEQVVPTLLVSAGETKLGSAGPLCSMFEGFALAFVLLLSGASIWGIGVNTPVYTSVHTTTRQRAVGKHLEFMAKLMEGNMDLGCGQATWRAYVLCFVGLLVDFVPAWIPEVQLQTLQKLALGLQKWNEHDLALSLLERGGPKAVTTVVESMI